MISIILASSEKDYLQARALIDEYVDWLALDLEFQGFEEEMQNLRQIYGPPQGGFLIIRNDQQAVGSAAVRKFETGIGELKRMYIQPAFQGQGLGRKLLSNSIDLARKLGYKKIRLDTLPKMGRAIQLYEAFGFYDIAPYRYNPIGGTRYLQLDL